MSAFSDLGYREDGPEEVEQVPGSVTSEAYRERLSSRPSSVAHIRATEAGDEALARIKGILKCGSARNGRGQSTTTARSVTPDVYWSAVSRVVRGFA